jgi:tetratricopeptide (TPR) repeat protein
MHSYPKSKAKILSFPILALLITAAYVPTFSGEFILDDRPLVKNNALIREFRTPAFYLSHEDGVSYGNLSGFHTGYYRPLISVFYTLDYKVWGMKPSGFRTTNLILHLLTCMVLYYCMMELGGGRLVAFAIALLFGLHPVNTETVAWISARNNILVTLFSLLSFYFYLKSKNERGMWAGLLSCLSFMAALLCKEFAVMLLPIFFLYNRLTVNKSKVYKEEILGYVPFILILFFYFISRLMVIDSVSIPVSMPDLWKRIYFAPFLIIYNLKLILLPSSLHSVIVDYPNDFLSWQAFAGFFCLGLSGFFIWIERNDKVVSFACFSFFLALFPVLNIFPLPRAVTVISMRWLYFPMTFLSFGLIRYMQRLVKMNRLFALCVVGLVVAYFGAYSYILNNNLWHDEGSFFSQEVRNFNNNFYAGGLAETLLDNKEHQDAERYFRIAINNYPYRVKNYINYSALLIDTDRPEHALLYLNKVKSLTMTHNELGQWFNNRAMAYFNLGKRDDALRNFKKAVIFSPNEPQYWANLGGAHGSMGDYINSVSALKNGLEITPESIQLRKNLAVTYIRMRRYSQAISVLEKVPPEKWDEQGINQLLKKAQNGLKETKE